MSTTTAQALPTRASLIHRLKNWQDQASWQDFFDTYRNLIYSMAQKRGLSTAEAQDVVQETMLYVAKQMPAFTYDRNTGSFKSWLLNVTCWRINDQVRKRAHHGAQLTGEEDTVVSELEAVIDPADSELEALWNAEWEKNLLEVATAKVKRRLDPKKYQIFDFCVNKEWDAPKVAQAFGIPVDDVYRAKYLVAEIIKTEVNRLRTSMI